MFLTPKGFFYIVTKNAADFISDFIFIKLITHIDSFKPIPCVTIEPGA